MTINWQKLLAPTPVAVMLVMGTALASLSLTYTTDSQQTVNTTQAPVIYEAGADATTTDYVSGWTLSTEGTNFQVTVSGVPEATLNVTDLFKVHNQDDATHTITISTAQHTATDLLVYKIDFYNATDVFQGTLDITAASPSVTFTDMPAGAKYRANVVVKLDEGATTTNVGTTSNLDLSISDP